MKRLFRWLFRLLILAIVLVVALVLLKDTILKAMAEWRIRKETGLSVTISKLEVGLFSPTFTMEGFRLFNTPEFGGSVLLDIPQVHFEYEPREAASRKLRVKVLRLNLGELNLVRNQAGKTNLFSLAEKVGAKPAGQASQILRPQVEFGGIDRLYLTVSAVKYTDLQDPRNNWQQRIGWKDWEVKNLRTTEDVRNWATRVLVQIAMSLPAPPPGSGGLPDRTKRGPL